MFSIVIPNQETKDPAFTCYMTGNLSLSKANVEAHIYHLMGF